MTVYVCAGKSSQNNVVIIVIVVIILLIIAIALCWVGSVTFDCVAHVYKQCYRCIKKARGQATLSPSSSSFDLASSTRALSSAMTARHYGLATATQVVDRQPHVVVVRAQPPSYSAILLTCEHAQCCCSATCSYPCPDVTATAASPCTLPRRLCLAASAAPAATAALAERVEPTAPPAVHCSLPGRGSECLPPSYSTVFDRYKLVRSATVHNTCHTHFAL